MICRRRSFIPAPIATANMTRAIIPAIFSAVVVIVLSVAMTSPVIAQESGADARESGGRRGSGRGSRGVNLNWTVNAVRLLRMETVRTDLSVSEEQGAKIDAILKTYRKTFRALYPGRGRDRLPKAKAKDGAGASKAPESKRERREKMRAELAERRGELLKKTTAELEATLEAEQIARLRQIELQLKGSDELVSDSVAATLNLSKNQIAEILGIVAKRDKDLEELASTPRRERKNRAPDDGEDRERPRVGIKALVKKAIKVREDAEAEVMAVLSDAQREQYARLKGAPFVIDPTKLYRQPRRERSGEDRGRGRGRDSRRPPAESDA